MLKQLSKISAVIFFSLIITACGSNKKTVSMNVQSDPLGAYALMQVKYKGNEDADWIFLGPTPINQDKKVVLKDASTVSLKVIRPGFYEQVKSWKAKDFLKESRQKNGILWVPNMVQQ